MHLRSYGSSNSAGIAVTQQSDRSSCNFSSTVKHKCHILLLFCDIWNIIQLKTQFEACFIRKKTSRVFFLPDRNIGRGEKDDALTLANPELFPVIFNEQILPPEQPIKASLISGFNRAATVLHILRL